MSGIPRYCPFEDPPALCTRECGMGACARGMHGVGIANPRPTPELVNLFANLEHMKPCPDHLKGQAHEHDCPDPEQRLGGHVTCPCWACFDTGYLEANVNEIECDCGAAIVQSDADMRAECARIASVLDGRELRAVCRRRP